MFVQFIKGKTSDPAAIRSQSEKWRKDVGPGAIGFLGGTGGVADDGTFVYFARFADEASAQANSDRAEQATWWEDTAKYLDGEPDFSQSDDVTTFLDGGSDDAGFVQVMQGTVTDRAKAEAFETPEMLNQLRVARPDLIGSLRVWLADGAFAEVAYFTSEADARQGESSEEFSGPEQQYMELYSEMSFIDIREPILTPSS